MLQPRLNRRYVGLWMAVMAFMLLYAVMPVQAQGGDRSQQSLAFLSAYGIPASAYRDLSVAGGDPQQIMAVLAKNGFSQEQIQSFMTTENVMALNQIVNPNPAADLLGKAVTAFGAYNLTQADLVGLLPLTNDPQAMAQALAQKGLSQEQITGLLGQVGPIIQEANQSGVLKYAITLVAEQAFQQTGACVAFTGCNETMAALSGMANDPEQMTAYLKQMGLSDQQIQASIAATQALVAQGLTPDVVTGWNAQTASYRLEGLGISPQELSTLVELGNLDAIREYLSEQGISGDALELALVNLEGALGAQGERLTPEALEQFQANEALALFEQAGLDPETMGDILEYKDDPEAMRQYLTEQGLDDAAIDAFVLGLGQSTFAKTVDPEASDDFLMSVENALYEQEVGSEEGTGGEEEYTEEEASEEEYTEEEAGEEEYTEEEATDDSGGGEDVSGSEDSGGGEDAGGGEDSGGGDDSGG